MKPFTLHAVLEHRRRLEDQAKGRLYEAKKIYRAIEEKLDLAQQKLARIMEDVEIMQQEGVEITRLIQYEFQIYSQNENIAAIRKNLAAKKKIVDQEQENLLARAREKQVMEKLRDEQNSNWRKYLLKKETLIFDEIATIRHSGDNS